MNIERALEILKENNYKVIYDGGWGAYELLDENDEYVTGNSALDESGVIDYVESYLIQGQEELKKMKKIEVKRVMATTYENDTVWIEYTVDGKYGYEIYEGVDIVTKEFVDKECNSNKYLNKKFTQKHSIDVCSTHLKQFIEDCRESENEMWYVDLNEMFDGDDVKSEKFIDDLAFEVKELGLNGYIELEYGNELVVYGGIITKFLF